MLLFQSRSGRLVTIVPFSNKTTHEFTIPRRNSTTESRFRWINPLQNRSSLRVEEVSVELEVAEHNCDVILQTAETMMHRSLLFHDLRNPSGMIDPLRELVGKLKTIYSFIRRDLRLEHSRDIQGLVASEGQDRPTVGPESFDNQRTLCPLVLFFRIISQGLNAYRINIAANSDWGAIRPLHGLLNTLQRHLVRLRQDRGRASGQP